MGHMAVFTDLMYKNAVSVRIEIRPGSSELNHVPITLSDVELTFCVERSKCNVRIYLRDPSLIANYEHNTNLSKFLK